MLDVLEHWHAAECDLHQMYGIDAGDRGLLESRPWSWLETRLQGLIDHGPRLSIALRTRAA